MPSSGPSKTPYKTPSTADARAYDRILHPDGRPYYAGGPLSLADAQILLNDAIIGRTVPAGAYLRVDGPWLVLEPAPRQERDAGRRA